mmetsp:Transcript_22646/g.58244  ORF Transcript_22646/g.58244 Transcript_22646/m.58244 type:complete len:247 (-) Transcript_22646:373-1113(-)
MDIGIGIATATAPRLDCRAPGATGRAATAGGAGMSGGRPPEGAADSANDGATSFDCMCCDVWVTSCCAWSACSCCSAWSCCSSTGFTPAARAACTSAGPSGLSGICIGAHGAHMGVACACTSGGPGAAAGGCAMGWLAGGEPVVAHASASGGDALAGGCACVGGSSDVACVNGSSTPGGCAQATSSSAAGGAPSVMGETSSSLIIAEPNVSDPSVSGSCSSSSSSSIAARSARSHSLSETWSAEGA